MQFASEHLHAKKIGYINHDDAYGSWNLEAAQFQAKKDGATLDVQSINPTLTDVTAPMLKIRAANPDVLVLAVYDRPTSLLIKKAHELGFNKPIIISVNGTADTKQLAANVGDPDAFKNVYTQGLLSDVPGGDKLKWVYDMYKTTYPDLASQPGHPTTYMPEGITPAMVIVNALKAVGPDLTREKVADALAHTNLDTGITAGPIVFTPTDHAGQKSAIYMKFDGTTQTRVPGTYTSGWTYTK